jgi:rubrerythrin
MTELAGVRANIDGLRRLRELRARNDAERGRPLTPSEQLANLQRAIDWTCIECGHEVEPKAKCPNCGWANF